MQELTADRALAFRIMHIDNLQWFVGNGLHCQSSGTKDPNFTPIGNADLISKRVFRAIPVAPGGTLADYVPFYFTPKSMMMYNMKTGYSVAKQQNSNIIIIVTSVPTIVKDNIAFLFSDRHAYTQLAAFSSDTTQLASLPWDLWRAVDFRRDNEDIGKTDRYQAELLIHKHLPVTSVLGVVACDASITDRISTLLVGTALEGKAHTRAHWYF